MSRSRLLVLFALLAQWAVSAAAQESVCLIALDTGHDPSASGARSARGRSEYEFNHELTLKVRDSIAAAGIETLLINPTGQSIMLADRTAQAAKAGASLFLAIHHDAVQPLYLTHWQYQGRDEAYSDKFRGFGLFVSEKNPDYARSVMFAETLGSALLRRGLRPSLHHAEPITGENRPLLDAERGIYRFDDLVVLKTATMPALLLEAGVIVHREEEILLATGEFQSKIAAAIAESVAAFCSARRSF